MQDLLTAFEKAAGEPDDDVPVEIQAEQMTIAVKAAVKYMRAAIKAPYRDDEAATLRSRKLAVLKRLHGWFSRYYEDILHRRHQRSRACLPDLLWMLIATLMNSITGPRQRYETARKWLDDEFATAGVDETRFTACVRDEIQLRVCMFSQRHLAVEYPDYNRQTEERLLKEMKNSPAVLLKTDETAKLDEIKEELQRVYKAKGQASDMKMTAYVSKFVDPKVREPASVSVSSSTSSNQNLEEQFKALEISAKDADGKTIDRTKKFIEQLGTKTTDELLDLGTAMTLYRLIPSTNKQIDNITRGEAVEALCHLSIWHSRHESLRALASVCTTTGNKLQFVRPDKGTVVWYAGHLRKWILKLLSPFQVCSTNEGIDFFATGLGPVGVDTFYRRAAVPVEWKLVWKGRVLYVIACTDKPDGKIRERLPTCASEWNAYPAKYIQDDEGNTQPGLKPKDPAGLAADFCTLYAFSHLFNSSVCRKDSDWKSGFLETYVYAGDAVFDRQVDEKQRDKEDDEQASKRVSRGTLSSFLGPVTYTRNPYAVWRPKIAIHGGVIMLKVSGPKEKSFYFECESFTESLVLWCMFTQTVHGGRLELGESIQTLLADILGPPPSLARSLLVAHQSSTQ